MEPGLSDVWFSGGGGRGNGSGSECDRPWSDDTGKSRPKRDNWIRWQLRLYVMELNMYLQLNYSVECCLCSVSGLKV